MVLNLSQTEIKMEKYTTMTADGTIISRGVDAEWVVFDELTYDGGSFDIRKGEDGEWHLYSKYLNDPEMREAIGWTMGVEAKDEDEARVKLFADAFASGIPGARIQFMTDADYDQMQAEAAAEEA